MSDKIRETRTAAFAACPETGCDWSSFWRGWQAALAQQPAPEVPETFNEWFLALPEGRQVVLREDRWMLADAAYAAGKLAAAQSPTSEVPEEQSLDARLEAAGMLTVSQLMQGQPIDPFIKHAGVQDLATFSAWLDLKCKEFLSLKARRELEKQEGDELHEWVFAHAAVFHEVRVNFKAATAATPAPVAVPVAQEPVAWLNPATGDVWSDTKKKAAIESCGTPGSRIAVAYSTPLYAAPPAAEQPDTVAVPREVLRELTDKAITEWHDPSENEAAQDRNECLCCGVEDGHNADCAVAIALRLLAGGAE